MIFLGLKELYHGLEDRYYAMLDWLDKHGLPVYKVVDAIEANNIPSFPLFVLLCIIIIGLLWVFAISPLVFQQASLTVSLSADGESIAGEKVILKIEGIEEEITKTSSSSGEAKFSVPLGKSVTIRLGDSEDYTARPKTLDIDSFDKKVTLTLTPVEKTVSRVIKLFDSEGKLFDNSRTVSISFSCTANDSFTASRTSAGGQILLEGIPTDCGFLNLQFPQGVTAQQVSLNPELESLSINLLQAEARVGKALVSVKDSEAKSLAGIKVQLLAVSGSDSFQSAVLFTNATGNALFENIPIGSYKAQAVDDSGEYTALATEPKEIRENETASFTVVMQKSSIGSIKFSITDKETGAAVQNAKIDLFKGSVAYGTSKLSDAQGKAEFKVGENVEYAASIDHPDYLKISGIPARISSGEIQVELVPATPENSKVLTVRVVDERGLAVEFAKVKLVKASDSSTVEEQATGSNGIAQFLRLEEGNYIVRALKPGFGERVQSVQVVARQENIIDITLVIGSGIISLSVIDSDSNPVPNASVEVFDSLSGEKISAESLTDSQGKKNIQARADKTVFLKITAESFSPYYTLPIAMAKDNTFEKQVVMQAKVSKLEMEALGIFAGEEKLLDSLDAGQKYSARFLLKVPEGSYTEVGVHLRTGVPEISGNATIQVEADPLFLGNVKAGGKATVLKGKTYNPPNNYALDVQNLTQSEAKWANIAIPKASEGVFEIEAEVITRDGAAIGTALELRYRAWAKSTGYLRNPRDEDLGTAESSSGKQGLYADTDNISLSIGPSSLCSESFCNILSIKNLGTGEATAIVDEYSTQMLSTLELSFSATFKGGTVKPGTVLKFYSEDAAIELKNYTIKGFAEASGSSLEVPVGELSQGSVVSGRIEFQAVKEGASNLVLELASGSEKLQTKEILLDVKPAKSLNAELIPKSIVPFIANNLLIKVTEPSIDANSGKPIAKAIVNFILNAQLLASVETSGQGIASYTLNSPPNNSKLLIEVKKPGYNTFKKEITINENIILFEPSELSEQLIVNESEEKQRTIGIRNASPIALTVKKIEFPKIEGLVTFALDAIQEGGYESTKAGEGSSLERDSNAEFLIRMKLTEKGKNISSPKTLKSTIDFTLENPNYSLWVARMPVSITIGFGEEADSADCLTIDPVEWKLYAENDEKTLELTLKNDCKISEEPIELQNLQAKVYMPNQSELGKFNISSELPGAKETELSNQFRSVATLIPKNSENLILLSFNPLPLETGASKPVIIFKAVNKTRNGDQELEARLNTQVFLNDLLKCVKITASDTSIQATPYGTGFGAYGSNTGSSPFNNWGMENLPSYIVPNTYSGTTSTSASLPSYMTGAAVLTTGTGLGTASPSTYSPQYYPDQSYRSPYLDPYTQNYGSTNTPYYNYYQQQYGNSPYGMMSWPLSSTSVKIENNCAQAVEIAIEPHSALLVQETRFALKPNEIKNVAVEAGYRMGKYSAVFSGRIQASENPLKELSTIQFTIQSATDVVRDCIGLDRTKFTFNDFIGRPVKGKIYNNCWDVGVRLTESADTVELSEMSERLEERIGGSPEARLAGTARILGLSTSSGSGLNGGTRQTLEFEIERDFRYRQAPGLENTGSTFQQIGALRYWLNMGYYRVQTKATLSVRFIDSSGGTQLKPFSVVLEDNWRITELTDSLIKGDPTLTDYQKCIKANALTGKLDDIWFGGIQENVKAFSPQENYDRVLIVSDQACSGRDQLTDLRLDKENFDGAVTISAKPTGDGKNIEILFDRSGLAEGASVKVSGTMQAMLESYTGAGQGGFLEPKRQRVNIPYDFTVTRGGEKPITSTYGGAVELCAAGKGNTGPGAVPKVKLDWKYESINDTDCDSNKLYCDAAQFTIEAVKKAIAIKPLVEAARTKPQFTGLDYTMTEEQKNASKNSVEIYRWVTRQVKIADNADNSKNLVFFLRDSSGSILDRKLTTEEKAKLGITGTLQQEIAALSETEKVERVSNLLELNILQNAPELAPSIVAEFAVSAFNPQDLNVLKELGAEDKLSTSTKVYISFNELKRMISLLKDTCQGTAISCDIAELVNVPSEGTPAKTKITTAFLTKFWAAMELKVGVRNQLNIPESDRKIILSTGSKIPDATALNEIFYNKNIDFNSSVVKDKYDASFTGKFHTAYNEKYPDEIPQVNDKWKFLKASAENPEIAAGKYGVKLKYYWGATVSDDNIEAVFSENPIEKAQETVLYNIAFDGKLKSNEAETGIILAKESNAQENVKLTAGHGLAAQYLKLPNSYAGIDEEAKHNGRILEITPTSLTYYPTSKVELTANIQAASTASRASGLEYRLLESTGGSSTGSEITTGTLLYWDKGLETTNALCNYLRSQPEAFVRSIYSQSGEFKATAFLPVNMEYSLQLVCGVESATVKKSTGESAGVTGIRTAGAGLNLLKLSTPSEAESIAEVLKGVESKKYCVKEESGKFEVYWNK